MFVCRFTTTGGSWCGQGLIPEAMREQVEDRLRRREEELVGGSKLAPAASTPTCKDRSSWLDLDDSLHFQLTHSREFGMANALRQFLDPSYFGEGPTSSICKS